MSDVTASARIESDALIEHNGDIAAGFVTVDSTDLCLHIKSAVAAENLLRAVWEARSALRAQENAAAPGPELASDPF